MGRWRIGAARSGGWAICATGRWCSCAFRARELCGGSFIGKRVALLGVTFKPNSDDIRDSPSLNVSAQMLLQGPSVVFTDPEELDNAKHYAPRIGIAVNRTGRRAVIGSILHDHRLSLNSEEVGAPGGCPSAGSGGR